MPFKSHVPFSDSYLSGIIRTRTCIYLVRDARDVLVSSYYYWKAGREPDFRVHAIFNELSFSQYLHGEAVDVGKRVCGKSFILPEMFSDPIKHWLSYAEWSNKIFTVRFEDLKTNYEDVIISVGKYIGRNVYDDVVKYVAKLVGHSPRKGIIGDWKNHFSEEDLEYVWNIAGDTMTKFGYEKDDAHLVELVVDKPVLAPEVTIPEPVLEVAPEIMVPEIIAIKPENIFKRVFKRIKGWF